MRSSRRRRKSPGLVARGRAVRPMELAEEARQRGCQIWGEMCTQLLEERLADVEPERARGSVLVLVEEPGPEAEAGAGSVASWETKTKKNQLLKDIFGTQQLK